MGGTMASDGTRHPQSRSNVLRRLFRSKRKTQDEADQEWRARMTEELDKIDRKQRIPEYDAAILSCSVTLQQIIAARRKLHKNDLHEEDSLAWCYEVLLWRAYQHAQGRIEEYYFGMEGKAAVVLTRPESRRKTRDLDLFYPLDELSHLTPDFESTLWTAISQFQAIAELDLKFSCQDAVFLELYLIVVYVFVVVEAQQANRQMPPSVTRRIPPQESLDAPSACTPAESAESAASRRVTAKAVEDITGERINEALKYANTRLHILANRIEQYSRREAQIVYIKGLYLGILFVFVLVTAYVAIIFWASTTHHWTPQAQLRWYLFAIAVASGALGATVSVMLRVSNRSLSIAYSAGRRLIWMAGFFRPIVGAIFGLVFYVLISAGLRSKVCKRSPPQAT